MSEAKIRFLQISDAMFDSPSGLKSLALSPSQRRTRTEEGFSALERALDLAVSQKVDAVLVAGNLFCSESVSADTASRLQTLFARLRNTPIIVCPGPFDPWSAHCLYSQQSALALGLNKWSGNVYVFSKDEHVTIKLPLCPGVTITARPYTSSSTPDPIEPERVAALQLQDSPIKILIRPLNLNRDTDGLDASLLAEERKAANAFSYTAFSGSPNSLVSADSPSAFGFCGTPFGQSRYEAGPRVVLMIEISAADGRTRLSVVPHELDRRRIVPVSCDVSGQKCLQCNEMINDALLASGARDAVDIPIVTLHGTYAIGARPEVDLEKLQIRFFHVVLENLCRPDYFDEDQNQSYAEQRFLALLNELRESPQRSDSSSLLEDCKYLGLAALREGKVRLRDAN